MCRLEHPHIVKIYECFEERQSLWVAMELCRGGELYEYVAAVAQHKRQEGGAFGEPEARLYFRQMLHAVSFLHKARIVHRDIKSGPYFHLFSFKEMLFQSLRTENFLLLGDPGTAEGTEQCCTLRNHLYKSLKTHGNTLERRSIPVDSNLFSATCREAASSSYVTSARPCN